jgi:hypothetical protein
MAGIDMEVAGVDSQTPERILQLENEEASLGWHGTQALDSGDVQQCNTTCRFTAGV